KYSIKQKQSIVRSIASGQQSINGAARELGCRKSAVQRWVIQYKEHGIKGFKVRNGRYSDQVKLQVVRYYLKKRLSLNEIAVCFKIPNASVISKWVKVYKQQGEAGLREKTRGRKRSTMTR